LFKTFLFNLLAAWQSVFEPKRHIKQRLSGIMSWKWHGTRTSTYSSSDVLLAWRAGA
jgi:hypothetical protein